MKQIFLKLRLETNPESHRRVLAVLAVPESGRRGRVVAPRALEICRDRIRRELGTARAASAASALQAPRFRCDVTAFRLNAAAVGSI